MPVQGSMEKPLIDGKTEQDLSRVGSFDHVQTSPNSNKLTDNDLEKQVDSNQNPNKGLRNVFLLGVGYFLLFLAYHATQNFQTSRDSQTDDNNIGSNSVGIIYSFYTFASLIAPFVAKTLGLKVSLLLGAGGYTVYIFVNVFFEMNSLYVGATLLGLGAGILWTAQGTYLTRCVYYHNSVHGLGTASVVGLFTGIFVFWYQFSEVAGNLLMALLFDIDLPTSVIFLILTGVACASLLCFAMLSHFPPHLKEKEQEGKNTWAGTVARIFETFKLWNRTELLFLAPISIWTGLSQAYVYGDFPALIEKNNITFYVLAVVGAADSLGGVLLGKLSDRVGNLPVLAIGFVCHATAAIFFLKMSIAQDQIWLFCIIGILLGIGDAVGFTQVFGLYSKMFQDTPEVAFANFQFLRSLAQAVAFFLYGGSVSFHVKTIIFLAFVSGGTFLCFISPSVRKASGDTSAKEIEKDIDEK